MSARNVAFFPHAFVNTSLVCAVGLRNEFRLAFTRERACLERSSSRRSCLGKGRMRTATLSVCFSIYIPVFCIFVLSNRASAVSEKRHRPTFTSPATWLVSNHRLIPSSTKEREHLSSIENYWQFLLLRICICFKCVLFFIPS